MSFAEKAIKYFNELGPPDFAINGVELINPYESPEVKIVVRKFYKKFYSDDSERIFVFGINPGRFGGGLTGISFTDPVALKGNCGIENDFGKRKELSSKFIYKVIDEFGGTKKFFSKVYLSALYPFAITRNEKNYNYYDDKSLAEILNPEIIRTVKTQIKFGARKDVAILLGKKNAEYFSKINDEFKFFERMVVLEHPRYIMQYRMKKIDFYIRKYIDAISI